MTDIILDLPAPPSVNRTRRVDWKTRADHIAWIRAADALVTKGKVLRPRPEVVTAIDGPYEAIITLSETIRTDLDNGVKALLDYVCRIELVKGDSREYLRRLIVQRGEAPEGCRVMLRSWDEYGPMPDLDEEYHRQMDD